MADTAIINRVRQEVTVRFPGVTIASNEGVCRKIADSTKWSQHSWGNALDIYPNGGAEGDRIYSWLVGNKTRLGLSTICWKSHGGCNAADHQDHVHVDGPKFSGTPPCAGGKDSKAGSAPFVSPGFAAGEYDSLAGLPGGPASAISPLDALGNLFKPETWVRVLWFLGGAIAVSGAVVIFTKELTGKNLLDALPAGRVANLAKGLI